MEKKTQLDNNPQNTDIEKLRTESILLAKSLGFTKDVLFLLEELPIKILTDKRKKHWEKTWNIHYLYSDSPFLWIHKDTSHENPIQHFLNWLKEKWIPWWIITLIKTCLKLIPMEHLEYMLYQTGMDHQLIWHIWNHLNWNEYSNTEAILAQIEWAKLRSWLKGKWVYRIILSKILWIVLYNHKKSKNGERETNSIEQDQEYETTSILRLKNKFWDKYEQYFWHIHKKELTSIINDIIILWGPYASRKEGEELIHKLHSIALAWYKKSIIDNDKERSDSRIEQTESINNVESLNIQVDMLTKQLTCVNWKWYHKVTRSNAEQISNNQIIEWIFHSFWIGTKDYSINYAFKKWLWLIWIGERRKKVTIDNQVKEPRIAYTWKNRIEKKAEELANPKDQFLSHDELHEFSKQQLWTKKDLIWWVPLLGLTKKLFESGIKEKKAYASAFSLLDQITTGIDLINKRDNEKNKNDTTGFNMRTKGDANTIHQYVHEVVTTGKEYKNFWLDEKIIISLLFQWFDSEWMIENPWYYALKNYTSHRYEYVSSHVTGSVSSDREIVADYIMLDLINELFATTTELIWSDKIKEIQERIWEEPTWRTFRRINIRSSKKLMEYIKNVIDTWEITTETVTSTSISKEYALSGNVIIEISDPKGIFVASDSVYFDEYELTVAAWERLKVTNIYKSEEWRRHIQVEQKSNWKGKSIIPAVNKKREKDSSTAETLVNIYPDINYNYIGNDGDKITEFLSKHIEKLKAESLSDKEIDDFFDAMLENPSIKKFLQNPSGVAGNDPWHLIIFDHTKKVMKNFEKNISFTSSLLQKSDFRLMLFFHDFIKWVTYKNTWNTKSLPEDLETLFTLLYKYIPISNQKNKELIITLMKDDTIWLYLQGNISIEDAYETISNNALYSWISQEKFFSHLLMYYMSDAWSYEKIINVYEVFDDSWETLIFKWEAKQKIDQLDKVISWLK